ncbi:MAG TPA: hypothetical protein VL359_13375, partial [bacterium]|nr:hypothetical protein [bacterium]
MTQPKTTRILAIALIGGLAAYALIQHQAQVELRAQNVSLQQQSEQMARLCAAFRATWSETVAEASSRLSETVTIDCASDLGPFTHCGSGFLYGFSSDGSRPSDGLAAPLKVRLHRARIEDTLAQAGRMQTLGVQQQIVVSDAWGYNGAYPGDHGNWGKWEKFIRQQLDLVRKAGVRPQLDLWNEPDHGAFWKRTPEQFIETWVRACRIVRAVEPSAVIVGPSWSNVHPGQRRFDEFLLYCRAHGALPDYITWHFPKDTPGEVRACREFCAREGIQVKGILINEYCNAHEQTAANTAWHLAQLERARVDGACHAVWDDTRHYDLDGILLGNAPRGQWWVYRRYAEMEGRLLGATPSANVEAAAAADSRARTLNVLLGRRGGTGLRVVVRLDHLDALPFLAGEGSVRIMGEQIP